MRPKTLTEVAQLAAAGDSFDRCLANFLDEFYATPAAAALSPTPELLAPQLGELGRVQDAYLAAHQAFGEFTYTDDGAFTKWLCRIIDHRLCDLGDRFAALKRQPVELPRADASGPITKLDRAEHRERLSNALDQLSEDHRQVLLLRYFEGLGAEEAGQKLQRSAGAVRNLTARALVELGKILGNTGTGPRHVTD